MDDFIAELPRNLVKYEGDKLIIHWALRVPFGDMVMGVITQKESANPTSLVTASYRSLIHLFDNDDEEIDDKPLKIPTPQVPIALKVAHSMLRDPFIKVNIKAQPFPPLALEMMAMKGKPTWDQTFKLFKTYGLDVGTKDPMEGINNKYGRVAMLAKMILDAKP